MRREREREREKDREGGDARKIEWGGGVNTCCIASCRL